MLSTGSAEPREASGRPRLIRRRATGAATDRMVTGTAVAPGAAIDASTSQRLMWAAHQSAPQAAVHNVFFALRLHGPLDVAALSAALDAVVARHATLRTTFARSDRHVRQIIQPAAPVALPVTDLHRLPVSESETALSELLRAESVKPFELEVAPLLRARLARLSGTEHVLALTVHHIAVDGESVRLLLLDLGSSYAAVRRGEPAELPPLPAQYADVAIWESQRRESGRAAADVEYWRSQLAGLKPVTLGTDRPPPARPTHRGAVVQRKLPAALVTSLTELAEHHRASAFHLLLAGLTALLHRSTRSSDIVIGAAFGGRPQVELEQVAGPFMRILPIRVPVGDDPTFVELIDRARDTVLAATEHQQLPYAEVVEAVAPVREPGRYPLARISLAVQPFAPPRADLAGLRISTMDLPVERVEFDVEFGVRQGPPGHDATLWAKYSTDLFDADRIERTLDRFVTLLTGVAAQPACRIGQLPLLRPDELARRMVHADGGSQVVTGAPTLHHWLVPALEKCGDGPALTDGQTTLSGAELLHRSARLAGQLRAMGIGPDQVVGVCLSRSISAIIAQLAVLRAGGAFLPLDPDHPPVRRTEIAAHARAEVVIVAAGATDLDPAVRLLVVDADGVSPGPAPDTVVDDDRQPTGSLAYVLFTSGSTGRPKGVMIGHDAALAHLADAVERFGLRPGDRFLQSAANVFDSSITQIFAPLAAGACVCVASEAEVASPPKLALFMAQQQVTHAVLTPTVASRLPESDLPRLRLLGIAGERLTGSLARTWQSPGRTVVNLYGPTECTVEMLAHVCSAAVAGDPPLGRPLPGRRAYAVDTSGNLAPDDEDAELWIGGAGLARGYVGGPGLTAERFVPDPFGPPGSRAYRTGDLVRQSADGTVGFVGRIDHELKIGGIRVDPAETETALRRLPGVRDAVVSGIAERRGVRLAAYLTLKSSAGEFDETAMRAALVRELPRHLVPSWLVVLDEFPLTRTGKVDRNALPAPRASGGTADPGRRPADSSLEDRVTARCAELLEVSGLGAADDLFVAGATSLELMDLMAWAYAEFGVRLEAADVFAEPTARAVANHLRQAVDAADTALLDEISALTDEEATRQLDLISRASAAAGTEPDGKGSS